MKIGKILRATGIAIVAATLAGCVEDTGSTGGSGLSGTQAQFDGMVSPCIAQAERMTGAYGRVSVLDRIQTGGGPILTLNAAGAKYTCRLEDDGTVTVFSEFAN